MTVDRSRRLIPAVVLGAAAAAVVLALPGATDTDGAAWIALRPARALLAGSGPAFTPGDPLEATASPAWVGLLAGALALGLPPAGAFAALGLASAAATVGVAAWTTARLAGRLDARAGGAAVGVALSVPLALAATTGHEAPLWAAALVLAVGIAADPWAFAPVPAGLLVGALALVRPEGLLVSALLAAFGALRPGAVPGSRTRWLAACLAPGASLLAARVAWSGDPVPHGLAVRLGAPHPEGLIGGPAELVMAIAAPIAALLPRTAPARTLAALLGLGLAPVGLVDPDGGGGLLACQVLGWCALASADVPRGVLGAAALAGGLVWVAPETSARLAHDRHRSVPPNPALGAAVAELAPRLGPDGSFGAVDPAALGVVGWFAGDAPVRSWGPGARTARAAPRDPPTVAATRAGDPPRAWPGVAWTSLGTFALAPQQTYELWSSSSAITAGAASSSDSSAPGSSPVSSSPSSSGGASSSEE